uniref:Polyprotein n=1 Tax=Chrysanthemum kita-like virus TaxID=3051860 RepID=A0A9Y2DX94_9VIRU|nr:polyprotein [Chrysanthemum kita-like virus]
MNGASEVPRKKMKGAEQLLKTRVGSSQKKGSAGNLEALSVVMQGVVEEARASSDKLTPAFMDNVTTTICSKLLDDPSATFNITRYLTDKMSEYALNKESMPKFKLKCELNSFQEQCLRKTFPMFNISKDSVTDCIGHSVARQTRKVCEAFIERCLFDISEKSSCEPGRFLIKDCGASLLKALKRGDIRIHSCSPHPSLTGFQDACRRSKADEVATRRREMDTPGCRELIDAYRSKSSKYFCENLSQNCTIKALYLKFLFTHDMSFENMCSAMLMAEAQKGGGCLLFSPNILISTEGVLQYSGCKYKRFKDENGYEKISFSFFNDTQPWYVHDYAEYVKFFTKSQCTVMVGGITRSYAIEFRNTFVDVMFFEIIPLNYNVKVTSVFRSLPLSTVDSYILVMGFRYDLTNKNSDYFAKNKDVYHMKPFQVCMRSSLYDQAMSYAMNRQTDFTVQKVYNALSISNDRTNISGTSFIYAGSESGDKLDTNDLVSVASAIYLRAYRLRYELSKTVSVGVADQEYVKELMNAGLLTRMMAKKKATDLESLLDTPSSPDELPDNCLKVLNELDKGDVGNKFIVCIRNWFEKQIARICSKVPPNLRFGSLIVDSHQTIDIHDYVKLNVDDNITKLRAGNFDDVELFATFFKELKPTVEKGTSDRLLDSDDCTREVCNSRLEKIDVPTDGTDCFFLACIFAGINEKDAVSMRVRLANSPYMSRMKNAEALRHALISGDRGEAALCHLVSYEYGVKVCLHSDIVSVYGSGRAVIHIEFANAHYSALRSVDTSPTMLSGYVDDVIPPSRDIDLRELEEKLAPYNSLEVTCENNKMLVDTYVFLTVFADSSRGTLRVLDPLGQCTDLFSTLPTYYPVMLFSGFNQDGDPCIENCTSIFGPEGIGEIRYNEDTVSSSLLSSNIIVDVCWLNADDWSSSLRFADRHAVNTIEDIRVALRASLVSLRSNCDLVIRTSNNKEEMCNLMRDVGYYFERIEITVSRIAKHSSLNAYIVFRSFYRAKFIKDTLQRTALTAVVNNDTYNTVKEGLNRVYKMATENVTALKVKYSALQNCPKKIYVKKLENLVKLQRMCLSSDLNRVFIRTSFNLGGGLDDYDLCEDLIQDREFILCNECFKGFDYIFQTGIINDEFKDLLGIHRVINHDCIVVPPLLDIMEVCSEEELEPLPSTSDNIKEVFSEVKNCVVAQNVNVVLKPEYDSDDDKEETFKEETFDVVDSDDDEDVRVLAAEEAKEYLRLESEDVLNECRQAFLLLRDNISAELRTEYVKSRNQQIALYKNGNLIAESRASHELGPFNYYYDSACDLMVSQKVLSQSKGYGIVTERCCPFLADDILNKLGSMSLDLSHLKSIEFIQAVPGAGKTHTIIHRHSKETDLVVTQTKSGRDDLIERVKKEFGVCNERNYKTTASVLVNGLKDRYPVVYFDEAAQQHAGFVFWVASISKCERMICYGDRNQIPFIPRVSHFQNRYSRLADIVHTESFLSQTYRVPRQHLPLLQPLYNNLGIQMTSANTNENCMVKLLDYSELLLQEIVVENKFFTSLETTVVLTFTQSEKGQIASMLSGKTLPKLFQGVFTLNEYQGRDASTVIIVRFANNNKSVVLYNDPNQLAVGLSRHKKNLFYLTCRREDELSCRISDFNRKVGGGYGNTKPCFQVKNILLKDVPRGSAVKLSIANRYRHFCDFNVKVNDLSAVVVSVKKLLDDIPEDTLIYLSDDIYSRFDGELLNSVLPKLFNNRRVIICSNKSFCLDSVNRIESEMLVPMVCVDNHLDSAECEDDCSEDDSYVLQAADVQTLQFIYNVTFPMSCLRPYHFDRYEINNMMIQPKIYDIKVTACAVDFVNDIRDSTYLTPVLETHMADKRLNTIQEQLLGLYKRNANVSSYQVAVNHERQVHDLIESFESCLMDRDYKISISKSDTSEWLSDKGKAQIVAVQNELGEVMDFSRWVMMIKADVKPTLTDDVFMSYPAVQTILYCSKSYNAIFAPFLNKLRKRILDVLHPKYFILSDDSIEGYEQLINANSFRLKGEVLELDMGKFDKSQGITALLLECEYFLRAQMPRWMVNLWFLSHIMPNVKGFGTTLRTKIPHQRRSGDPWTFGGNTIFLLSVLKYFCSDRINYLMVSGDDSLVFGDFPLSFRREVCSKISRDYLFDVKLCTFESKYFCSKFLVRTSLGYKLVPDPIKMLIKLGRKDLRDYQHVEEYRISMIDHVRSYKDLEVRLCLQKVFSDRYPKCPGVDALMESLCNVVYSKKAFQELFLPSCNIMEEVILIEGCQDRTIGHLKIISDISRFQQGQKIVSSIGRSEDLDFDYDNTEIFEFFEDVINKFSLKQYHDVYENFISCLVACGYDPSDFIR